MSYIDSKYLEIVKNSLDKKGLPKPFVQEVELLSWHIAGTTFLDLDYIEPKLIKRQLLILKREPKNKNDDNEYNSSLINIENNKNDIIEIMINRFLFIQFDCYV